MSYAISGMTVAAPTVATAVIVSPEYIRLPAPGEHDPLFGLTRSYLNLLILPTKENHLRPPVRSSVLRQPQAKTGVRLVNVASLRRYLKGQMKAEAGSPTGAQRLEATTELSTQATAAEFMRLPRPKDRDPIFGLSRTFLNQLILPTERNHYRPPVYSHVLRRRGYRTGIRLISVDSLRQYIIAHEEPSSGLTPSTATGPGTNPTMPQDPPQSV